MIKKINNRFDRGLSGKGSSYSKALEGFIGMDVASDAAAVAPRRMAYCLNMWRDYESDNGGAIETVPGWRSVKEAYSGSGKVNGLFGFRGESGEDHLVAHIGNMVYRTSFSNALEGNSFGRAISSDSEDRASAFFESGGRCYMLDGKRYGYFGEKDSKIKAVSEEAYVPTTYFNGNIYEQRNMLSSKFKHKYTVTEEALGEMRSVWNYELITDASTGEKYLKIIGAKWSPKYAFIPEKAYFEGKQYNVKAFAPGVFDALTETVQLVVDAPLSFYGAGANGGMLDGSVCGMLKLERVVLRNADAVFAFNACDRLTNLDGSKLGTPTAPLRELWISDATFSGYDVTNDHEYSDKSVGITSAYEGNVTVYAASENEIWCNGLPRKTNNVYGVKFGEAEPGEIWRMSGVHTAKSYSEDAVELRTWEDGSGCSVIFNSSVSYPHVHFEPGEKVYGILIKDKSGINADGLINWYNYTV